MDTNTMKQICELIQGMGADGKEAFIIWVFASNALSLLITIIVSSAMYNIIASIVNMVKEGRADTCLVKKLRDLLKVGSRGEVTNSERDAIAKKVSEFLDRQGGAKQG